MGTWRFPLHSSEPKNFMRSREPSLDELGISVYFFSLYLYSPIIYISK